MDGTNQRLTEMRTSERPLVSPGASRPLDGISRDQMFLGAAMLLSSFAALSVLATRFIYSGTEGYGFMVWNLFLAWIPLALALPIGLGRVRGRSGAAAVAGLAFLWLLFFPNAPYLLTEFQHLHPQHAVSARPIRLLASVTPGRDVPLWYDVVLVLLFAWNGLLLSFVSLRLVQRAVAVRAGRMWGWATVVVVFGLSGFGVSIGRFQRWNSWDLFSRPAAVIADVAGRIFNPLAHPRTSAVTVLFAGFLLLAYVTLLALTKARDVGGANHRSGAMA
jgi:uncharacterized membrane protein